MLKGWQDSRAFVSLRIVAESIALEGYTGSIEAVSPETVVISTPGIALWIDLSSASGFSWGPVGPTKNPEDSDFDPFFSSEYDSVLKFESQDLTFFFAAAK